MRLFKGFSIALVILPVLLINLIVPAQSGKGEGTGRRNVTLNVIVRAPENKQVTKEDFELYDASVLQEVESFYRVDAGSRIVLMIDDSSNLRAETEVLQKVVKAIIDELYEDDQMMVIGYNENAEIIEDMTPELTKLQACTAKLTRKGFPNLFDALVAVADSLVHQAKTGIEKRAIILISDGYDSESKTKFDDTLKVLQDENILLYAIKTPDRTRGALLRDKPKPPVALDKLTSGTGGSIYTFEKFEEAAKAISDDLRKNWFRLTYSPAGINTLNMRRLLIVPNEKNVEIHIKDSHPGKYK
jgi:VWFA-related protein